MKDLVVIKRARFIANSLQKSPAQDSYFLNFFNVSLVEVSSSDECDDDPECCDKILRSATKIPVPLRYGVHPFNYVGSPGGAKAYGWTTFGMEAALKAKPLTGTNPRYTYANQYVYVFNKKIDTIRIEGVFPDPRLLAPFMACDDSKPCFKETDETFVDEQTAELIIDDILMKELRLLPANEKTQVKTDHNV